MIDLIMLGQIPGTSIQISFAAWLAMAVAIGVMLLAWRHQAWREQILAKLARLNRHWQQHRELKRLERLTL